LPRYTREYISSTRLNPVIGAFGKGTAPILYQKIRQKYRLFVAQSLREKDITFQSSNAS
jgi:hypothetical protein